MKLSNSQQLAIKTYKEENNLKLALSSLPYVSFIKENGQKISIHINELEIIYRNHVKIMADIKKSEDRRNKYNRYV